MGSAPTIARTTLAPSPLHVCTDGRCVQSQSPHGLPLRDCEKLCLETVVPSQDAPANTAAQSEGWEASDTVATAIGVGGLFVAMLAVPCSRQRFRLLRERARSVSTSQHMAGVPMAEPVDGTRIDDVSRLANPASV